MLDDKRRVSLQRMEDQVVYPIYRKYAHNRTFFKIVSEEMFYELQIMGKSYSVTEFKAKILPDRNYIHDLTYNYEGNWEKISEAEYDEKLAWCEGNLKRFGV